MKAAVLSSLVLATLSDALHLPVQRVRPRASGSTSMSKSSGGSGLTNLENDLYTTVFQVGGTSLTLALDTGSSDLWFAMGVGDQNTFAGSKTYEPTIQRNLSYGTGSVVGNVAQLTTLDFAGFTITNQSYLSVTAQDEFFSTIFQQEPRFQGLAGLSFDTLSDINNAVYNATADTWGRSLMSNVFLADPSTPNHIAFFLDRTGDLNDTDTGSFDIGTYAAGYEAVANEPKHTIFSGLANSTIQWNVILTGLTIGGKAQKLESGIQVEGKLVNVPPAGSLSALFDTGTSAAQIPADAFKVLYESLGGVLITGTGAYAVPCTAQTNVEFAFGNQTVFIHPLDLTTIDMLTTDDGQNLTYCKSLYEMGEWEGGDNDVILGDAFLRNAYVVYNYGDFVKTESGMTTNSPFIQFLPLTNSSAASDEFSKARAAALASMPPEVDVKTINDPNPKPASNGTSGGSSGSGSGSSGSGSSSLGSGFGSSLDATGSGSNSSSGLSDDSYAQLKSLSTLAPIMLGLLGVCVALLVVLIAVAGVTFARLGKQGTQTRGAYVPVSLPREGASGYKDEPHAKYDTQFRD